jgi:gluconate 2-dehydrogenase gamma chain
MGPDRREFIFSIAALAAAPPRFLMGQSAAEAQSTTRALSRERLELLAHFCEQLIPTDDFPGARELGVAEFIDRTLREAHPGWIHVYEDGLGAVEATSRKLFDVSFPELTPARQIELIERMERGELPAELWVSPTQTGFFSMVRSHAMQGYYSHPQWGGNRDKAAWKMIGYDDWWV